MLGGLLPALRAGASSRAALRIVRSSSSSSTAWLTGAPPTVDLSAQTFAASYYGRVLAQEPSKDVLVSVDSQGQDVRFTLTEFNRQVVGYAVGLLEGLGLKRGAKVGLWLGGELEHATLRCAAGLLGVEVVVIDPAVGFAGVRGVIAGEGLHALILSPRHGSEDRRAALRTEFAAELAVALEGAQGTYGYAPIESKRFRSLKHIVCTSLEHDDAQGALHGVIRMADLPVYGPYDFDEVAALQAYVSHTDTLARHYSPGATPDAPAVAQGAPLTHADLLSSTAAAATAQGLQPGEVFLSTTPLHTAKGFSAGCLAPLLAGAKLLRPTKAAFDASAVLALATQQRPSRILLHSPAEAALLSAAVKQDGGKQYDIGSIKAGAVLTGGSASLGAVTLKGM